MSMAATATTTPASNPLAALGGGARVADDSDANSSDSGTKSFNSALVAAQSSQSGQASTRSATQSAPAPAAGNSEQAAGEQTGADGTSSAAANDAVPASGAKPAKASAKATASRIAANIGAAKLAGTAQPTLAAALTEQAADADEPQVAGGPLEQASAPEDTTGGEPVPDKASAADDSATPAAAVGSTISEAAAQALAGLVHQLLAKDSRSAPAQAPSEAVSSGTAGQDSGDAALSGIAAAATATARTAVAAAGLREVVIGSLDSDAPSSADSDPSGAAPDSSGQAAASVASLAAAGGPQASAAPVLPERVITVPVQSSQWPQALATEIRWMTGQNVQSAVLRLSPDHLGPMQVNINVNASHVNVSFGASHPETRAALEQALPKLRDMLSGAGLTLGEATVQQQSRQASQNANPAARGLLKSADTDAQPNSVVRWSSGLVDEYA